MVLAALFSEQQLHQHNSNTLVLFHHASCQKEQTHTDCLSFTDFQMLTVSQLKPEKQG